MSDPAAEKADEALTEQQADEFDDKAIYDYRFKVFRALGFNVDAAIAAGGMMMDEIMPIDGAHMLLALASVAGDIVGSYPMPLRMRALNDFMRTFTNAVNNKVEQGEIPEAKGSA